MSQAEIPLFPLRSVLFPEGHLPLRIFEQRYLSMVRECARSDTGFGVCLIMEGEEAVSPVRTSSPPMISGISICSSSMSSRVAFSDSFSGDPLP